MLDAGEDYHDLATLVRAKAAKNGSRTALVFDGRTVTYAELDRESERVAAGLARAGVRPGERVAALLFNTAEFPLLWFGAAKARAVLVPLNTGLKGEILRYELADSTPRAIVLDPRLWPAYEPLREGLKIPREYVIGAGGAAKLPPGAASFPRLRAPTSRSR
jgi:carnitine-CoA ligase